MATSNFIEFLVMRHGRSVADKEKVYEGWWDHGLTGEGFAQARRAGKWIAQNYELDVIVTSTLPRALQTIDTIIEQLDRPVRKEYRENLRERNNGLLGGLTESQAGDMGFLPLNKYGPDDSVEGGETLNQLRRRAQVAWRELLAEPQDESGRKILVVSHGQMIRMLYNCFMNSPADKYIRCRTGDTGIHHWLIDKTKSEPEVLLSNHIAT